jgi:hypothetical protein
MRGKRNHDGKKRKRLGLLARTREMTDVMLRIAERAVAEFPEDVERVERVRQFLCASRAGAAHEPPPAGDLLFVMGVLIDALDLDCHEPEMRLAIEQEIDTLLAHDVACTRLSSPEAGEVPRVCPCCGEQAFLVGRTAA